MHKYQAINYIYSKVRSFFVLAVSFMIFAVSAYAATSSPEIVGNNASNTEILTKTYIQVTGGCNWNYTGGCLSVRSGPGAEYRKVNRLRNGIVLKVSEKINTKDGAWYKISFADEKINKPTRIKGDWYVSAKYVKLVEGLVPELYDENVSIIDDKKRIYINIKTQTLEAYNGNELFLKTKISTGLSTSPTLPGEYFIHYKTPSRYMQDDGDDNATSTASSTVKDYYDLPGVPFDMYFDEDGKAIHGTYWHNNFGKKSSHGCVNLPLAESRKLYEWAPAGTSIIIK